MTKMQAIFTKLVIFFSALVCIGYEHFADRNADTSSHDPIFAVILVLLFVIFANDIVNMDIVE